MKVTVEVDDFGRIVLPKAVRTVLGIFKRTPLRLEVVGDKAELSVLMPERSEVKRKSGRTVYAGQLPEQWDSGEVILEMRAKRSIRA